MLNFALKGSFQDATGYSWDYYRDDQLDPNPDPNAFYIIPRPQFVLNDQGKPSFGILTYQTDGADNGSGSLRFDVELSVPADIEAQIAAAIKANPTKFPGVTNPTFLSLALNKNSTAAFNLPVDGATLFFSAAASNFGSNTASFLVNLTKSQLQAAKALFSKTGGALDVIYYLSVPARLQGVSAVLTFDSAIAYQYQVTQPTYDSWGDETSPGSVQSMLQESASSKVSLTWGLANPPQQLVKDVTDWANNTLSDLVSAEVQKAISLQNQQSSADSFSISEVASFTNTYAENIVIDWLIAPTASLPSFPDMNLDMAAFETTVNKQQQQMTVSTNLPFYADSLHQSAIVPKVESGGVLKEAYIKSVDITVKYPTLSQANASYTFKANGANSFSADFDPNQGSKWSLIYNVNYQDPNMPMVSGTIDDIELGNYTLKVEEAGILSVVFDASQVFATELNSPDSVEIAFSYLNTNEPTGQSVLQILRIAKTSSPQTGQINSLRPMPVSTGYNYQTTYVYPGSVTYQAPLVQNANGASQVIQAANAMKSTNVIIFVPASALANDVLLEASASFWYETPPNLPAGVSDLPTQSSPAVFTFNPQTDSKGNAIDKAVFVGLVSADQPLMYSGSITMGSGEVDIPAQNLQNTINSVMVSLTQRYFTLEINPDDIKWAGASFNQVEVLLTIKVAQGTASSGTKTYNDVAPFTWNTGESGRKYFSIPILDGNTVTYDVVVNYNTVGTGTKQVKAPNLSDAVYDIPAQPTP